MEDRLSFETKHNFTRKKENKFTLFFKRNWGQLLILLSLIVLAILVLYPLFILLIRSFKSPDLDNADPFGFPTVVTFENYMVIWPLLKNAYLNSFVTTISVTVGTVLLSSMLAYAFIRFNFPGKKIIYYLIISLMMIPGILTLITRFQMVVSMGLINTYSGVILPGIAGYIPSSFVLLFVFFTGLPKDLFEAAEIDGASDFKTYTHIVAPLSTPILWTIGIQTFVGEWNDYLWAKLILNGETWKTLPVYLTEINYQTAGSWTVPFAGYILSSLPLVFLFIAAGKQFISGMTSGAVKM